MPLISFHFFSIYYTWFRLVDHSRCLPSLDIRKLPIHHTSGWASLTCSQDSIKRTARRNAWYDVDDDGVQTYNPFGRVSNRPRHRRDEESDELYHAHTDNPAEHDAHATEGGPSTGPGLRHHQNETSLDLAWTTSRPNQQQHRHYNDETKPETVPAVPTDMVEPATKSDLQPSSTDDSVKARQNRLTLASQMKALLGTWASLLFVFVLAGFAVRYTHQSPVTVFIINFIAIVPSNAALGFAVNETLKYVGNTRAGLINTSFG